MAACVLNSPHVYAKLTEKGLIGIKVRGPFVETPRIFLCMQNINYAEILA